MAMLKEIKDEEFITELLLQLSRAGLKVENIINAKIRERIVDTNRIKFGDINNKLSEALTKEEKVWLTRQFEGNFILPSDLMILSTRD